MPGYNGLELLAHLKEKEMGIQVIFISGYSEFEYAQSALRMGAFDYLLKPIEQDKLNEVLTRIQDKGSSSDIPRQEEDVNPTLLNRVIREIKDQYTENITLTGLSEKYKVSTSHLSSLIKAELGLSFSEYLASKRIQKAKELLADETLSIDSIAEMVGYNDYFYFTKVFKKSTGISPSKYRKNLLH